MIQHGGGGGGGGGLYQSESESESIWLYVVSVFFSRSPERIESLYVFLENFSNLFPILTPDTDPDPTSTCVSRAFFE